MKTIEERAEESWGDYTYRDTPDHNLYSSVYKDGYIKCATDQKKIDIERAKEAFDKAVGWCRTYQWYQAVCDEFVKHLEGKK